MPTQDTSIFVLSDILSSLKIRGDYFGYSLTEMSSIVNYCVLCSKFLEKQIKTAYNESTIKSCYNDLCSILLICERRRI